LAGGFSSTRRSVRTGRAARELLRQVDHLELNGEVVENPNAFVFAMRAAPLKLTLT
jgi:hypothetical protein